MIRHRSAAGHGIGRRPETSLGLEADDVNHAVSGETTVHADLGPFNIYVYRTADDLGPDPKASARRRITDAGIVNPPHSQFTPSIEPRRSMSRWAATCAAKRSMEAVSAPASGSEPAAALTTLAGKPAASLN
jgi:hypothetical protein